MPEHFHFLQPLWFLALLPMALLLWWLPRAQRENSQWQRACESHLLPYLLNKPVQAFAQIPLWLLAAGWLVAVYLAVFFAAPVIVALGLIDGIVNLRKRYRTND